MAILAHELGHWKLNHTLFGILQSIFMSSFFLFSFSWFVGRQDLFTAFGFSEQPTLIGLLLFSQVFVEPLSPLLSFLVHAISRAFEYQADAFAHGLGYSSQLQQALLKLHVDNLSSLCVDPLFSAYHYSHPPLAERLQALQQLDRKRQ